MTEEEFREKLRAWYKQADWKNRQDYPDDTASPNRWAWEFLRRNADFAAEHMDLLHQSSMQDPAALKDYRSEWRKKWKSHLRRWGISSFRAKDWGSAMPDSDSPCVFCDGAPDMPAQSVQFKGDDKTYLIAEEKPNTVLIRFDYTKPIGAQIKLAERHLNLNFRGEKEKAVQHAGMFSLYLRTFDARVEGTSWEVAADLFQEERLRHENFDWMQALPEWEARANEYIQGDYRQIPFALNPNLPKKNSDSPARSSKKRKI